MFSKFSTKIIQQHILYYFYSSEANRADKKRKYLLFSKITINISNNNKKKQLATSLVFKLKQ